MKILLDAQGRVRTRCGVLVETQGREYRAYCNECDWESYSIRTNLVDAKQMDADTHTCQEVEA